MAAVTRFNWPISRSFLKSSQPLGRVSAGVAGGGTDETEAGLAVGAFVVDAMGAEVAGGCVAGWCLAPLSTTTAKTESNVMPTMISKTNRFIVFWLKMSFSQIRYL